MNPKILLWFAWEPLRGTWRRYSSYLLGARVRKHFGEKLKFWHLLSSVTHLVERGYPGKTSKVLFRNQKDVCRKEPKRRATSFNEPPVISQPQKGQGFFSFKYIIGEASYVMAQLFEGWITLSTGYITIHWITQGVLSTLILEITICIHQSGTV